MKLTIIPSDGAVYKDRVSYHCLLLSGIPDRVHALQWDGEIGFIEFVRDEDFNKHANEIIYTLPDWAISALLKWDEAEAAEVAAKAAAEVAAKAAAEAAAEAAISTFDSSEIESQEESNSMQQ